MQNSVKSSLTISKRRRLDQRRFSKRKWWFKT